jgi:vacuolar-type H+-ATPase subunit E/Vma4
MGIQEILERIRESAESRGQSIISQAEKQAGEIIRIAQLEADGECKRLEKENERRIEAEREQILSKARRETRLEILQTKERLINEVFERSKEIFLELDEGERREAIEKLIREGEKNTGKKSIIHICRPEDRAWLSKKGYRVAQECIQGKGGVVVSSDDGYVSVDMTLEGILKRNIEELRVKIAKILF